MILEKKYELCFDNNEIVKRAKDLKKKLSSKDNDMKGEYTDLQDVQSVSNYY